MTPTANDVLQVWDLGQNQPAWQKALLMLAPCLSDLTLAELLSLPLGRRNALLLELRRRMLGPTMHCLVYCPECREPLEFSMQTVEFLVPEEALIAEPSLTSRNLALAAAAHDLDAARLCLEQGARTQLQPGAEADAAYAKLLPVHASADLRVVLECAAGGHVWSASFDIVSFLWVELEELARSLLEDVRSLARTFGWPEREILAMSAARRKYYLEVATG